MSKISFNLFNRPNRSLVTGGGIPGFIPQAVQTTGNYDEFAQDRFIIRQAWGGICVGNACGSTESGGLPVTPFRAITNSGDLLSRPAYSCGGPCQTFQSRPGLFGLKGGFGHISDKCDGSGIPPSSCNVKYVYDSSNYTRYLKENAIQKVYNDSSYGGDDYKASQSAIRAIHRY